MSSSSSAVVEGKNWLSRSYLRDELLMLDDRTFQLFRSITSCDEGAMDEKEFRVDELWGLLDDENDDVDGLEKAGDHMSALPCCWLVALRPLPEEGAGGGVDPELPTM